MYKRPYFPKSRLLILLIILLLPILLLLGFAQQQSAIAQTMPANNQASQSNEFAFSQQPVWESLFSGKTTSLAWGDMDNDGDLDLAVGNSSFTFTNLQEPAVQGVDRGQRNFVFLNEAGVLNPNPVWSSPLNNTLSVAWGDLNGDGYLDLAIGNDGKNEVYLNNNGQLSATPSWQSDDKATTFSVSWGDLDQNGLYDLIASTWLSGTVVYYNHRENSEPQLNSTSEPIKTNPDNASLFDPILNRASDQIVWGDIYNNQQAVQLIGSFGSGLFVGENSPEHLEGLSIFFPSSLALGDANGDGRVELAVGEYFGDGVKLLQFTDETEAPEIIWQFNEGGNIESLAWGDVDGDGDLDLAVGGINVPVRLYRNESDPHSVETQSSQDIAQDVILSNWTNPQYAWGDLDNDQQLELVIAGNFEANSLYRLDAAGHLMLDDSWHITDTEATQAVAFGDMDGDGDLDLAVGNFSKFAINKSTVLPDSVGRDQVFLNNNGRLEAQPIWLSADDEPTTEINWWDYDGDGDLDLIAQTDQRLNNDRLYLNDGASLRPHAIIIPHQPYFDEAISYPDVNGDGRFDLLVDHRLYLHNHTPAHPQFLGQPTINIAITHAENGLPVPTAAQGNYDEDGLVTFEYEFSGPQQRVYDLFGFYSLNGGQTWHQAKPTASTTTQKLSPGAHTYSWDVFGSGVVGTSDHALFRLQLRPNYEPVTGGFAGFYQRPFAQTETLPFRVRGRQVQLLSDTMTPINGQVYRLSTNSTKATLMGNATTGITFRTNQQGFLNGRAILEPEDKLFGMLPITQTYRIPPQLYFPNENGRFQTTLTQPPTTTFTAEFWVNPFSHAGNLLTFSDDIALSYQAVTDTAVAATQFTLTLSDTTTFTTSKPFLNGEFHQLAFSWDNNLATDNTILYLDGDPVLTTTHTISHPLPINTPLILGEHFIGELDEIRLWQTARTPAQITTAFADYQQKTAAFWPTPNLGTSALLSAATDDLLGYWPIMATDSTIVADLSGQANDALLEGDTAVTYKSHYTAFHTSADVTNTVPFQHIATGGVQTLAVSADNPLLLFDLDVALEWDASNDTAFLAELETSFARASEILYDVTNGQVALRQINFFYDKLFWGQADIIIHASNSLRPSATIGGVVTQPRPEYVYDPATDKFDKLIPEAYLPGHIRMGTVWDPFGERTAELGEEWSRALAHELSHYLFFLPDNYLGFDSGILRLIESCSGSFMSDNIDPANSEFLAANNWSPRCDNTLAQHTTGRSDWETVRLESNYPMLKAPEQFEGPGVLPLDFLVPVVWTPIANDAEAEKRPLLPSRYFTLQAKDNDGSNIKARLPNAQGFLIKTQGNDDASDDLIINLGTPTGGGDRLKVRGASVGDRLCVFGRDDANKDRYAGCKTLTSTDASLLLTVVDEPDWPSSIDIDTQNGRIISITTQITTTQTVYAQIYPLHYPSISGLAPTTMLQTNDGITHTGSVTLPLPAYEVMARIWVEGKEGQHELITTYHLNPPEWSDFPAAIGQVQVGSQSFIGNPISRPVGDPISRPVGDPISRPVGDPISRPVGDPISRPVGDPISRPVGDPISRPVGDPISRPVGDTTSAFAPIRSADAQVVIYNNKGFFEDNGIIGLQALPEPPDLPDWFIPVGQAYHITSDQMMTDTRIISFSYLQRNVPDGYENSLSIYFLPDACLQTTPNCVPTRQPVASTQRFVENRVAAPLVTHPVHKTAVTGTYAVLSTIPLPPLQPGWNLFAYPLIVSRPVTEVLGAIDGQYDAIFAITIEEDVTEVVVQKHISSLNIRTGPSLNHSSIGYLRRNEGATVIKEENGWYQIVCPPFVPDRADCWVTAHPAFVHVDKSSKVIHPITLTPTSGNLKQATIFQTNGVYWIHITAAEPVTISMKPPVRQVTGELK